MRSGWDARKRNRNIGTAKQGRGQDNRLVIPRGIRDSVYWEKLVDPVAVRRSIWGNPLPFLVEPTFAGFVHACTIDDICFVLEQVPGEHLREIQLILLRQPKRKENILRPAWGRFIYYADTGEFSGTAICIEAQDPSEVVKWGRSLSPDDQKELESLRHDGHRVNWTGRSYLVERTTESIRSTQLYRTLLHELGHCVDWLTHCVRPAVETDDELEQERIQKQFEGKPACEKEAFAHRYARELRAALEKKSILPFARILNPAGIRRDGLDVTWFEGS